MAYTTIDDPSAFFKVTPYVGNNVDGLAITHSGDTDLQADFFWIKMRGGAAQHVQSDTVRGILKVLNSNSSAAEDSNSEGEMIKTVTSNGFTLGDSAAGQGDTNSTSGRTYVAWCWKANGSGSSNEDGTINTTATSANTTAGFSISTYTGTGSNATIGHGLNSAPTFWVVKPRTDVSDNQWFVCHHGFATDYATDFIHFDTNGAVQDNNLMWNDTAPTSSVISLGTKDGTNKSSGTYVCYAWHEVQGYSKFGTYTGNGSADGPYIHLGFKPAWLMIKERDNADDWIMFDNKRVGYNVDNNELYANTTSQEGTADFLDLLASGFKLRATHGTVNTSGSVYIYMAFAEAPLVNSNGVPCTAR